MGIGKGGAGGGEAEAMGGSCARVGWVMGEGSSWIQWGRGT